jgi:GT2 family glycosyltransferase
MYYPTVSVIVLSHNDLGFMEDCFVSLTRLDYPDDRLELVLADNASTDGTVEYVRERFPNVRIIQFDQNYAFCLPNNRAAERSKSEYVAFLNSDMRVEPDWLTGLVEALADEPGVVCASSKILDWDGEHIDFGGTLLSFVGFARASGYHDPDLTAYDNLRYILAPCGGAMLIDRQVFLQVGGFDPDFVWYFEDVDLGWRLWILGYKVVFAPKSVCYHIHFGASSRLPSTKPQYLYERNALYTIIKNYEQQYLDRVLPVALLMHFKRAYLFAMTGEGNMDEYRFDPTAPAPLGSEATGAYNLRYYLREAWRTLRARGWLALVRKAVDEVDRRRGHPVPKRRSPEAEINWQRSLEMERASITAANDVLENFGAVAEKRAAIQRQRQRSDQEIFETVCALSFDVVWDTPEYRRAHEQLLELFKIDQLFSGVLEPGEPFASTNEEPKGSQGGCCE